jgi:hypothetical protein
MDICFRRIFPSTLRSGTIELRIMVDKQPFGIVLDQP